MSLWIKFRKGKKITFIDYDQNGEEEFENADFSGFDQLTTEIEGTFLFAKPLDEEFIAVLLITEEMTSIQWTFKVCLFEVIMRLVLKGDATEELTEKEVAAAYESNFPLLP